MAAILQFYSVFVPKMNLLKMRICDAFVEKIREGGMLLLLNERVLLRNGGGDEFVVEVVKESGKVYFGRGWEKFVEKNGLQTGYVMIFRYDGVRTFDVKIYDYSCCEIEFGQDPVDPDHEDNSDEDEDYDYYEEEEESEDRSDVDYGYHHHDHKVENSSKKGGGGGQRDDEGQGTRPYHKHNWKDSEAEPLVKPDSLYFVGEKGSRKRLNQLQVPAMALRDFNIELDDNITYIDPLGRELVGKVSRWKTGQTVINKWGTFCKLNTISDTDKCVFELEIDEDRKCRSMLIHIIRKPSIKSASLP